MPTKDKRPRSESFDSGTQGLSAHPTSSEAPTLNITKSSPTAHQSKKLKLLATYTLNSPFPAFEHPTPSEAQDIYDILSKQLRSHDPARKLPLDSRNSAATCGNVPNVIESLIGTILSQNTSGKNSAGAKTSLDAAFGRNNFAAIAEAPQKDVVEAIRHGGLANKKAATIQDLLKSIKERHGDYSLQHLIGTGESRVSDDAAMQELVSYSGVGPKTASCVLLFCLGRDSFAVDTHVFRLSKVLGWVPNHADRLLAQAHLDLRIPRELKYGLHVLMIQHGRLCMGCKNKGKGNCVLKAYVKDSKPNNVGYAEGERSSES